MKRQRLALLEFNELWYLEGVRIRLGDEVILDELSWKIVAWGRSPARSRTPFLWLHNELRGVKLFSPALHSQSCVPVCAKETDQAARELTAA